MWHYIDGGKPSEAIDDATFEKLIASGRLTGNMLVWKEGMTDWKPLSEVRGAPATVASATNTCTMCGKIVGEDNLIDLLGHRVCAACKPLAVQSLREGAAPAGIGTAWSDGKKVVTYDKSTLPTRCYKCNAPATNVPLKRKVYWHPPAWYLLILVGVVVRVGILLYILIAAFIRKRATVEVHLCAKHLARRRTLMIVGWSVFGVALVLIVVGAVQNIPRLIIVSALLFSISLITFARIRVNIRATKIQDKTVWLSGAHKDFIASLPPWTGK